MNAGKNPNYTYESEAIMVKVSIEEVMNFKRAVDILEDSGESALDAIGGKEAKMEYVTAVQRCRALADKLLSVDVTVKT